MSNLAQLPDIVATVPQEAATHLLDPFKRGEVVILKCYVVSIEPRGNDDVKIVLRPTGAPVLI